jgi:membrane protease YdiL (CAAX protease family)
MDQQTTTLEKRNPIFFNSLELRAGWRLLIFVALFYVLDQAFGFLQEIVMRRVGRPSDMSPTLFIVQESLALLILFLATWIMSRIEGRNMGEYGLPLKNQAVVSRFIAGYIFWGFVPLSLLLLALRALHVFYFGSLALHHAQIVYWGAVWGFMFMLVGLLEEFLFRGYVLRTLADGIGFWPAAVLLAALFAFAHSQNPGETRIGIIMTAFFAMFAAAILRYTGNLWLAAGAHAGWDWGQSYFYGVADSGAQLPGHLLNPQIQGPTWLSGGTAGPEGSILALLFLSLMAVFVVLMYRRTGKPALFITTAPNTPIRSV